MNNVFVSLVNDLILASNAGPYEIMCFVAFHVGLCCLTINVVVVTLSLKLHTL